MLLLLGKETFDDTTTFLEPACCWSALGYHHEMRAQLICWLSMTALCICAHASNALCICCMDDDSASTEQCLLNTTLLHMVVVRSHS